ncbi:sensor histidine kinase [Paenibacillus sacheonensis]|uniref:HAMP domain-containing protein n=1 Tax=Paenibacillus sacheonensis TaxID=742054 RepID=A0A7X4YJQ9_9BACL|nr:histidine kinase [Paenibacillus sacheonensis]MBM7564068.1 sensor histidine kinase YesM [Paenibacillus sacheonensis]NBC67600.1 HAMP domain-containing protein [Paenibacillus sacheonensis]
MARRFSIRNDLPFTYKMMIAYLALVLVTDIVIGYVSYGMLVKSRTEVAETGIRAALEQTRNNVDYRMTEIRRISDQLFSNLAFQRALQHHGDRLSMYYTMIDDIFPELQAPLELFGSPIRLTLYAVNPQIGEAGRSNAESPIARSEFFVQSVDVLKSRPWFRQMQASGRDTNVWIQADTDKDLDNISLIRKLVSYGDYQTAIGYVRITVNIDSLIGNLTKYPKEQGMGIRVIDRATGKAMYERDSALPRASGKTYLNLREEAAETPFSIEVQVPREYLSKDAKRLQRTLGLICAASFAVMGGIGFAVAALSGRRMKRIVSLVRAFQDGKLDRRLEVNGNDEFGLIAHSFNSMAASIQTLIQDVYRQGIHRKQAELEALQAQINPHFLYNTLSTISSLNNLGKKKEVTATVKQLSRFYRLTLNNGQVIIPLEKELQQVSAYLDIQRVKYADAFQVYVDMEPELQGVKIIKLLLQPFVENIFKHAWFGETIAIRLTAKRAGNDLELKVIDTGIGMRPETVERVLRGAAQSNAYGLKNVEERIKLRYGPDYGVQIASVYGGGTTVRLLLPIRTEGSDLPEDTRYPGNQG